MHQKDQTESTVSIISKSITNLIIKGCAWIIIGFFRGLRWCLRSIDAWLRTLLPTVSLQLGKVLGPFLWIITSFRRADNAKKNERNRIWWTVITVCTMVTLGLLSGETHSKYPDDTAFRTTWVADATRLPHNSLVHQITSLTMWNAPTAATMSTTEDLNPLVGFVDESKANIIPGIDEEIDTELNEWLSEWQNQRYGTATLVEVLGTPVISPLATPRLTVEEYIVQPGDTIPSIARRFGLQNISITANNPGSARLLRAGQVLRIPPADGLLVVIPAGQSLVSFAQRSNLTNAQLRAANPTLEPTERVARATIALLPDYGGENSVFIEPAPRPVTPPTQQPQPSVPVTRPTQNYAGPPSTTRLLWPLASRRITQYFRFNHTGLDVGTPLRSEIWAAEDGVVIHSGCGRSGCQRGYGIYVVIDHGNGLQTLYAHNIQSLVSVGDRVIRGQQISWSGSTGRSTGPHLHFEVRQGGRFLNPLLFIR